MRGSVFGDPHAGVQRRVGMQAAAALLDRQGYEDIEMLSDEVIRRSGRRCVKPSASSSPAPITAKARSMCRRGRDHAQDQRDHQPLDEARCSSFAGSSDQSPYGINVVMNYTMLIALPFAPP